MKIGFDPVPIGGYFGNSTYTTELIRALAQTCPDHTYFVPAYFGTGRALHRRFDTRHSIKILPILPDPKMLGNPFKKRLTAWGRSIESKKAKTTYDLYHCTSPVLFNDCCPNTVVTIHDLIPLLDEPSWASSRERNYYKSALMSILEKSSAVITDSCSTKLSIAERFAWCEEKILVITLAAGPQFAPRNHPPLLARYGLAGKPFMLSVGVFSERKNMPFFLEAFAGLPKDLRKGVNILLTGNRRKNKPYPQILDCIARHNLEKNVFVIPNIPQNDLVALYSMALCLVFPSLYEGFGLPVLEAMACGCPVITSSTTSLPEVGGDAVVYVNPVEPASLRAALEKMVCDENLRKALKERGLSRAGEFSWEKTAAMTLAVYREVMNPGNHSTVNTAYLSPDASL
jgi:alpha-1,3-rhamnosyl/mannosyltransferase